MIPDTTRQSIFLKEIIEMRNLQNGVKNKLRKVLFAADISKYSTIHTIPKYKKNKNQPV